MGAIDRLTVPRRSSAPHAQIMTKIGAFASVLRVASMHTNMSERVEKARRRVSYLLVEFANLLVFVMHGYAQLQVASVAYCLNVAAYKNHAKFVPLVAASGLEIGDVGVYRVPSTIAAAFNCDLKM